MWGLPKKKNTKKRCQRTQERPFLQRRPGLHPWVVKHAHWLTPTGQKDFDQGRRNDTKLQEKPSLKPFAEGQPPENGAVTDIYTEGNERKKGKKVRKGGGENRTRGQFDLSVCNTG